MKDSFGNTIPPEYEDLFRHVKGICFHEGNVCMKSDIKKVNGKQYLIRDLKYIPLQKTFSTHCIMKTPDDESLATCLDCGVALHDDNERARSTCNKCQKYPAGRRRRHRYHCDCCHCRETKSFPGSKQSDAQLLGVELELNCVPEVGMFFTDKSTIEDDGTLHSIGGEIVSSPMTYEEHVEFWSDLHSKGAFNGCSAPKVAYKRRRNNWHLQGDRGEKAGDSHGMHVHVNRETLTESQWLHLCASIQINLKTICTFIGGRPSGLYRSFFTGDAEAIFEQTQEYHRGCYGSHGVAINATRRTVEMRFPKSSEKINVIIGRIGLIDSLVSFARDEGLGDRITYKDVTEEQYLKYLWKNRRKYSKTWALARQLNKNK